MVIRVESSFILIGNSKDHIGKLFSNGKLFSVGIYF